MNNLKVVAIPLNIAWADVDENVFATRNILDRIDKDTDIVVLPELFSTGFISTADLLFKFAEDAGASPTLKKIRRWAKKYNFAIAGSLLVREGDEFFNRGFFIEPSGDEYFYDKTHLFNLSSESKNFTAGSQTVPVIRYRGWNIALAICYELRFPAWLRNIGNRYDVLLLPANWPAKRSYAWEHLLIARAIENQAYVVGANRSGKDDGGEYDNQTFIFDYLGKPVHRRISESPEIVSAVFDREKLNAFRESFPVADDADRFTFLPQN